MNNKSKDIFKILIPILAIVIIIESVVVVSRLNRGDNRVFNDLLPEVTDNEEPVASYREIEVGANFVFSIEDDLVNVGNRKRVTLEMLPRVDMSLDAMDLYISYDPSALTISDLREEGGLSATAKKISDTGVVLANFWTMEEEGYQFVAGQPVELMSFLVEPKVVGSHQLSVVDRGDDVTKLVTSVDGEVAVYGFTSDVLVINSGE